MAEGQDSPKKITITIKTPKEKQTVEIEEGASIIDVSFFCLFALFFFLRIHGNFTTKIIARDCMHSL